MTLIQKLLWWLFVVSTTMIFTVTYFLNDGTAFILSNDATFITFCIITLYFITTTILGFFLLSNKDGDYSNFWFVSERMSELGLLGTLIGLYITLSPFGSGGITSENIAEVSKVIAVGAGTAILTTVAGVIAGAFLKIQLTLLGK